jgi:hypothetical protein
LSDDKPNIHAHVVLGKRDRSTAGGHLIEARVRPTLEVILTESPKHLTRELDKGSGLALITLNGYLFVCSLWQRLSYPSSSTKSCELHHMPRGVSPKRKREYKKIEKKIEKEGRYKGREKEIAARIVNKQRAKAGETKRASSTKSKRRKKKT